MSASGREVAHRLFAAEYDDATYSYSESDEELAPNYVVTPTGARVNRILFVGVLTEVEQVSDEVLRARVADPTGAFVVYAGQYQPDEMAFLEEAEPPMFVAVTGKARTFSPDDSDRVFTSVRPESINEVDAETRDRWTVEAAAATLARVATSAAALESGLSGDRLRDALRENGAPEHLAAGIPVAIEQYGTTEHYLAAMVDLAVDALELVADRTDEVQTLSTTPGDSGDGSVDRAAIAAGVDGAIAELDVPDSTGTPDGDPGGPTESGDSGEIASDADATATSSGNAGPTAAADEPDDPAAEIDADVTPETDESESGTAVSDESLDASPESDQDTTDELGDFDPGGGTSDDEASDDVLDEEERERIEEEYGTDFSSGTEVGEPGEADIEPEAGPIEPEDAGTSGAEPDDPVDAGTVGQAPSGDERQDEDSAAATEVPSEAVETGAEGESTEREQVEPDTENETEVASEPEAGGETDHESEVGDATEATDATEAGDAASSGVGTGADDVDLEAAVLDEMAELDEGDGADREAVVAAVVDEHGVDPGAVEGAIQDALMAGKCYEPDDETVKPI